MLRRIALVSCRRCVAALLILPLVAAVRAEETSATSTGGVQLSFGSHYGPATTASQQIQAEAQYLRAYGEMTKDLAVARIRHAEARRLEGANEVQAVRDHILKRDLIEADQAKRIGKRLTDARKRNNRIAERLKNHPEMNAGEIVTGVALNFLKNRLASTVVTFRAESMGSQEAVKEVAAQLQVTPDIVHALRVRQNLPRGESLVFQLDDGRGMQVDWWPPALRTPELQAARSGFEAARTAVFELRTSSEFDANIRKLILKHAALEEAFLSGQTREKRIKSAQACTAYYDAKAFLQSLSAEIRRLEKLGPGRSSPQSLAYQGEELPELLAHMVRNGLEFVAAKPGDEPAYHQVFNRLRDLYVAVETDADQPEASTKAVIPEPPKRFPLNEPSSGRQ